MKKLMAILFVFGLFGCSSTVKHANETAPRQKLIIDSTVQTMTRQEVIAAAQECETGGMKATIVYTRRRIGDSEMTTSIPMDVHCVTRN